MDLDAAVFLGDVGDVVVVVVLSYCCFELSLLLLLFWVIVVVFVFDCCFGLLRRLLSLVDGVLLFLLSLLFWVLLVVYIGALEWQVSVCVCLCVDVCVRLCQCLLQEMSGRLALVRARAALLSPTSACWVFSSFRNPPISDMNCRIYNVRT